MTTVSTTSPLTPAPVLRVAAWIGDQPAEILFAGEAPGFVAGIMQWNLRIPVTAPAGNLPVVVSVGGVQSQSGVTVSVK